jgi:hypothetical protein
MSFSSQVALRLGVVVVREWALLRVQRDPREQCFSR